MLGGQLGLSRSEAGQQPGRPAAAQWSDGGESLPARHGLQRYRECSATSRQKSGKYNPGGDETRTASVRQLRQRFNLPNLALQFKTLSPKFELAQESLHRHLQYSATLLALERSSRIRMPVEIHDKLEAAGGRPLTHTDVFLLRLCLSDERQGKQL